MLFKIFIAIVFIAELIIMCALIFNLIKLDKFITDTDELITLVKPSIKTVAELAKKISEQIAELVPVWIENLNRTKEKIIMKLIGNIFTAFIFWRINVKFINKIRKSKLIKLIVKGFNLFQNMV